MAARGFNVAPMEARIYLKGIKYKDKDEAKELGCRWDPKQNCWYCIASDYGKSNMSICVKRWSIPTPFKIIGGRSIPISQMKDYSGMQS